LLVCLSVGVILDREQVDSGIDDRPANEHPRITREKRTVEAIVKIYCRHYHGNQDTLCSECDELLDYAKKRLDRCPFQENKTTCVKCSIHCYEPQKKETVRIVMRYSGPRMIWRHPVMAIQHLLDGRKNLKKPNNKLQKRDSIEKQ
jgi:hypothetical protein